MRSAARHAEGLHFSAFHSSLVLPLHTVYRISHADSEYLMNLGYFLKTTFALERKLLLHVYLKKIIVEYLLNLSLSGSYTHSQHLVCTLSQAEQR